jgi:hypothetical protein
MVENANPNESRGFDTIGNMANYVVANAIGQSFRAASPKFDRHAAFRAYILDLPFILES